MNKPTTKLRIRRPKEQRTGEITLDTLQAHLDILGELDDAICKANGTAERLYYIEEGGVPAEERAFRNDVRRQYRAALRRLARLCEEVKNFKAV